MAAEIAAQDQCPLLRRKRFEHLREGDSALHIFHIAAAQHIAQPRIIRTAHRRIQRFYTSARVHRQQRIFIR